MPEQLFFTEFLNHYFGAAVTTLLHTLGIKPTYPQAPITNTFATGAVTGAAGPGVENNNEHRTQLGGLVDSHRADHVRARPLHELQVIGIIDDAVGVRVLEVDRQREMMLMAHEAAAIGRVERFRRHLFQACSERRLRP